ncbi:Stealth CR1 domain-containing protein [Latilactobacillus sakei]|uniref:Stealth CR1 domain-containing protein n=1 Tax=Latilactobacillus sakei TaxID=1599 RepID=UPI00345D762F
MVEEKIDFVVTWVDESDEKWLEKKKLYSSKYNQEINSEARYRNWDFLKYWFRSVEMHAPWVNKVYFITEGHVPEWLNTDFEKLVVVKHSEYIDNKYLPTFNSNVIELNLNKIKGLSDNFVSFNDDMFINSDVSKDDFFNSGLPRDTGIFSPIVPMENSIDATILRNVQIINKYFNKNSILKKNIFKFFNIRYGKHLLKNFCTLPWNNVLGFYDSHIPVSYNKETFENVWNKEHEELTSVMSHRFRTKNDLSHWLMRYWQICEGKFAVRSVNFGQHYIIGPENSALLKDISEKKHKVICLNDSDLLTNFQESKELILTEFRRKYGSKSRYEK